MDYGSGAIFGCLGHDQRDFDFAKKYNLSITKVVSNNDNKPLTEAYTETEYLLIDFLNGLDIKKQKSK